MMTAAKTSTRARACKKHGACVARRRIPDEIQQEVDRRLRTDHPPVAKWIARDLTAQGMPIGEGYVQRRAIFLRIPLTAIGRPVGSKNDPNRPKKERKPMERPLLSTRRDEARRLKVEEGKNNAEIGRALGISRQAVKKLLDAFPEELLQPGSDGKQSDNDTN